MTIDTNRFMAAAIELASAAVDKGELPIGAVVVLDGEIIAQAHTSEVADTRFLVHAELRALLEFDQLNLNVHQRRNSALFSTYEVFFFAAAAFAAFFFANSAFFLQFENDRPITLTALAKFIHAVGARIILAVLPQRLLKRLVLALNSASFFSHEAPAASADAIAATLTSVAVSNTASSKFKPGLITRLLLSLSLDRDGQRTAYNNPAFPG